MIFILIYGFLGLTTQAAPPAPLPEVLEVSSFQNPNFIEFPIDARAHVAPLGLQMTLDGSPVLTRGALDMIFLEKHHVNLAGGPVIVHPSGHAMGPTWDYPVGTRVFHEIRFRGTGELFEMRFLERLTDRWNFGTYLPETPGKLRQVRYNGRPQVQFKIPHPQSGNPAVLKLERVPQMACQNCHFGSSPSRYQYKGVEDTGPCSFGPAHPLLIDWAKETEKKLKKPILISR